MRKAHLRGRGPHFPILDRIVQYESEPGYVVFIMPSPKRLRVKVGDIVVAEVVTTDGVDEIVPRHVTTLALSFDHRHVDGEKGSRFLADVAGILSDPASALLF